MIGFNFFSKKVKTIVCNNLSFSDKLELINDEIYNYFEASFAIYKYNGTLAYGKENFKNLESNNLENISLYKDNQYNIKVKDYIGLSFDFLYGAICPFYVGEEGKVFILIYNQKRLLTEDELVILDWVVTTIFLLYQNMYFETIQTMVMKNDQLEKAISSLTYSEYEALGYILDSFIGDETVLVASSIAREKGITRSVIVSGLKKLTNANLIKSHSLGNKGTYIKILDARVKEKIR